MAWKEDALGRSSWALGELGQHQDPRVMEGNGTPNKMLAFT